MDGLEVFCLYTIRLQARQLADLTCYVTHQIFYELGILVGAFGYVFLVRALQQTPQFAGTLLLDATDQSINIQTGQIV